MTAAPKKVIEIQELQPLPHGEQGALLERVGDLTPLTDLVLAPEIRRSIDSLLAQHYNAAKLAVHGLRPANRVMFSGPPGTGKTACAGAIALALGIPMVSVRQDGLVQQFMGRTSVALRQIFDFAATNRAVVLIDEADSIAKARTTDDTSSGGAEMNRVVTSLLIMLEEQRKHSQSIVIAATNHEGAIDQAMWRRFDEVVQFTMPEGIMAGALMGKLLKRHGYAIEVIARPSAAAIVRGLKGMSFAEVERVTLDAIKTAAIDERVTIQTALLDAVKRQRARRRTVRG